MSYVKKLDVRPVRLHGSLPSTPKPRGTRVRALARADWRTSDGIAHPVMVRKITG